MPNTETKQRVLPSGSTVSNHHPLRRILTTADSFNRSLPPFFFLLSQPIDIVCRIQGRVSSNVFQFNARLIYFKKIQISSDEFSRPVSKQTMTRFVCRPIYVVRNIALRSVVGVIQWSLHLKQKDKIGIGLYDLLFTAKK